MTAIRSYIHSIITHIAIDWMVPVSCGLKMKCCSLPWRIVLVYLRTFTYTCYICSCGKCLKTAPCLHYRCTYFITTTAYRKHTNHAQGEWMSWTDMQYWQLTLYMTNSETVRLCYYTMEMRPFSYHFGNEMTSVRSYFHSIIRHTAATDWLGAFRVISKQNAVDFTDA